HGRQPGRGDVLTGGRAGQLLEVSAAEVTAAEVSAAEVSAAEVTATGVSAAEVSATEVSATGVSVPVIRVIAVETAAKGKGSECLAQQEPGEQAGTEAEAAPVRRGEAGIDVADRRAVD